MTDLVGWFPVALAADVDPGTSTGTRLFGRELVVWRDAAGMAHVWEDRCPHRGMRLSFGFVRGDHIACLYHGWRFDAAGRCRFIPAHPALDVPASIAATRLVAAERLGMIWAHVDGSDIAPDDDVETTPVRSITLRAVPNAVMAALATRPSPFGTDVGARTDLRAPLVSWAAGTERIVAAVQPLSDIETCLHLAIVGAPILYGGRAQADVSAWAEVLRITLEGTADVALRGTRVP